jgi:hypothetical protein
LFHFLFTNPWPGLALWCTLYISDYALTLWCAHMYQAWVHEKIAVEGSFELTPFFQRDINSRRRISPRFLGMLLCTTLLLAMVWSLVGKSLPELYDFALGALILLELAVHLRHLRNLFTFRAMRCNDSVRGRIEYTRPFILRMSAVELFTFSAFYLILWFFMPTWFLLGGVVTCLSTGIKHGRLARRATTAGQLESRSQAA